MDMQDLEARALEQRRRVAQYEQHDFDDEFGPNRRQVCGVCKEPLVCGQICWCADDNKKIKK